MADCPGAFLSDLLRTYCEVMGVSADDPGGREPVHGIVPLRRTRDFQLLWGGQGVSLLGSQTSKIAYPLLVLAMTGSPAKAGIAGFAAMLGYLLFPLPAGGLADRCDRKRIMIGCDAIPLLAVGSIQPKIPAGITITRCMWAWAGLLALVVLVPLA